MGISVQASQERPSGRASGTNDGPWAPMAILVGLAMVTSLMPALAAPVVGSTGGPDLTFGDIFFDTYDEFQEGDRLELEFEVVNIGDEAADHANVTLFIDDEPTAVFRGGSLAPDEAAYGGLGWNATEGDHSLRLEVDPDDAVAETNEENNRYIDAYSVAGLPQADLVPELDVHKPLPWFSVDKPIEVFVGTDNLGELDHHEIDAFVLQLSIDGETLREQRFSGIQDAYFELDSILLSAGEHTVTATVDVADEIEEADESNNVAERRFTVLSDPPPPDLRPSSSGALDGPVYETEPFTVGGVVRNLGDTVSGVTAHLLFDDRAIETFGIGTIQAGGATSVAAPVAEGTTPGFHTVTIIADPDGVVEETDEGNNVATRTFEVLERPDPAITELEVSGGSRDGVSVLWPDQQVTFTVANLGEAPMEHADRARHGATVNITACPSDGLVVPYTETGCESVGNGTIPVLDPGERVEGNATWSEAYKFGSYEICVVLEYDGVQQVASNDRACRSTYALATGAGLGGHDLG